MALKGGLFDNGRTGNLRNGTLLRVKCPGPTDVGWPWGEWCGQPFDNSQFIIGTNTGSFEVASFLFAHSF